MLSLHCTVPTVKDVVEGAHGGELVDEHAEVAADGVAEQADEVVVAQPRRHPELPEEDDVGRVLGGLLEPLHDGEPAAPQRRLVNLGVGPLPDQLLAGEGRGDLVQLAQRHLRHLHRDHLLRHGAARSSSPFL